MGEEEYLLPKTTECPVCDHKFKTLTPKSGRARRMESDKDLRPRTTGIDALKYNVICCPNCGYASLNTNGWYEHIASFQKGLVKEQIWPKFSPDMVAEAYREGTMTWSYAISIRLHKLSLLNAEAKKAKSSEKAYNNLVLSWLYRGMIEEMEASEASADEIGKARDQEKEFYRDAYEGFKKAMSEEMPPICGMDEQTLNYLLASMARSFGEIEVASKLVATILTSKVAGAKIKDKAREMKYELIEEIKARKQV